MLTVPVSGKVSAARELSQRMPLPGISQETFGIDIFEFSAMDPALSENGNSAPSSPSKSKRNSLHRRSLSGSNGNLINLNNITNEQAYQESLRMFNLETLALAFDSLEKFAHVYERVSKSVSPINGVSQSLTSTRTKRRRDSGSVQEDLQDLTGLLEDVESHVGMVVEEWLPTVADGKQTSFSHSLLQCFY